MKDKNKIKKENRERRHKRVRAKVFGTSKKPRLCVFKSNKYIYAQIIDDEKGKTLTSSSSLKMKENALLEKAGKIGEDIAKKAEDLKIKEVVFDRGGYIFTGRVKALVEGVKKGGLKF
ncbi:MAG: 50S ribosomal protein L18 [Candidatus Pacebacteria bacterium]|nr:50S ribosomal protein L18 [Candidatus Paceibacterota bacterium]